MRTPLDISKRRVLVKQRQQGVVVASDQADNISWRVAEQI